MPVVDGEEFYGMIEYTAVKLQPNFILSIVGIKILSEFFYIRQKAIRGDKRMRLNLLQIMSRRLLLIYFSIGRRSCIFLFLLSQFEKKWITYAKLQ